MNGVDVSTMADVNTAHDTVLEIADLSVTFRGGRPRPWAARSVVNAVAGASLTVRRGRTLGLVGESGSGKTTIGRAVLRLIEPAGGTITAAGFRVDEFRGSPPAAYRRAVQAVFQDPLGSLDPQQDVRQILAEPLRIHFSLERSARETRVRELIDMVGLSTQQLTRYPYELSGGQRQRVAIAKALAVEPELVVLDEPVSALDVSVQGQIINLLAEIQRERGISYLFIAHDLSVVRHASHDVAVLYRGRVMEVGPADRVCGSPRHPYTRRLFDAVPDLTAHTRRHTRSRVRQPADLLAQLPDLGVAPTDGGCPFFPRCPHRRVECAADFPERAPVPGGGAAACHALTDTP
ncbi:oligopeptide/dipeptide ABC transporter ATP-binding protein [Actinophytocola gossypii]|uniref:ABC transporter ATP-binding protein n=1 Tax=Actinophytocola gossypii TaxID=2812003 RepID=A0ABT2J320_9PSEU|nr:oligopeptide/dipeptide ABC transporter ATP-binding protein [Actinophytocola gossypii]MCT2582255.1 ABC transporter ATP-binding protein [Actinophytocola gossypii]